MTAPRSRSPAKSSSSTSCAAFARSSSAPSSASRPPDSFLASSAAMSTNLPARVAFTKTPWRAVLSAVSGRDLLVLSGSWWTARTIVSIPAS